MAPNVVAVCRQWRFYITKLKLKYNGRQRSQSDERRTEPA